MKSRTGNKSKAELGSGNVYQDLGFADADAMLRKAHLVNKISEIVRRRWLTEAAAGELLGLTEARVAAMLDGHFHNVPEQRLLDYLRRLGRDVRIEVRPARGRRPIGRLTMIVA